ncbi:MAG TPA: class I SAM-dependent methyltransferase, partial [bacterium]|nr:class I SAM-dependent methyltransferase [bacterium]
MGLYEENSGFGYEWTSIEYGKDREACRQDWLSKARVDLSWLKGKTVLEAGCGSGRHTELIAEHCEHITCIEISDAVNAARKRCARFNNVTIIQGDIMKYPFADLQVDYVFSQGVLHH